MLESLDVTFGDRARNGATNPQYQREIADRRGRAADEWEDEEARRERGELPDQADELQEERANHLERLGWDPIRRAQNRQEQNDEQDND